MVLDLDLRCQMYCFWLSTTIWLCMHKRYFRHFWVYQKQELWKWREKLWHQGQIETFAYNIMLRILWCHWKLDGLALLITDPPPTSSTTLTDLNTKLVFSFLNVYIDIYIFLGKKIVICDTVHLTPDTRHMTRNTQKVVNIDSNFRSLALTVWEIKYFEDVFIKEDWDNE